MSWAGFWVGFLLLSLAVYAVVAVVVSVRGGAELLELIRRSRGYSNRD